MPPFRILLAAGILAAASAAVAAETGDELRRACETGAERCLTILNQTISRHAEKEICPPHGYQPAGLRAAFVEWAEASDRDLLARASSEQAAFLALKELFSCEE